MNKFIVIAQMPPGIIPTEFQVFPAGQVEAKGAGAFTVDAEAMNAVIQKFQARGLDMVIDYEHQTEGKTDQYDFTAPDGRAPAAGWIKRLENRGQDGLWAICEWTDKAREYLASREYRYFSPVFMVSKSSGKLTELLRVALTNAPRLNQIQPIVAKNLKEESMEFLKKIAKLLGLPETATEDQVSVAIAGLNGHKETVLACSREVGLTDATGGEIIISAIKSLKEQPAKIVACPEVIEAIGLATTATKSEIIASIHALKQRPDATVLQEIASLKARLAERDKDDLVTAALKEGKITPAQKEWAEKYALADAEGFKLFVAKAPQVVPTDKLQVVPDPKPAAVPDDAQLQINKMLGVSDETWKKYNTPATA